MHYVCQSYSKFGRWFDPMGCFRVICRGANLESVCARCPDHPVFDHPQNPRHPTWWHARDYGLFAANPFGQHDFENLSDKTAGHLTIPAGQSVTFRYRFYLHAGDIEQAKVAQHYQDYLQTVSKPK